jgi:NAD(P)-dependent dehydrogenase (short-subunit alcohol dehydrogenase family)
VSENLATNVTTIDVLAGRTVVSRGIGLEIARTLARAGANIALIAKTAVPDPRLPGTIHEAAEELRGLGADVLPIVGDIRDEDRGTGNAVIVEDVLAEEGITDLAPYDVAPGQTTFMPDFFVDAARLGHEPANPVDLAAGRP